MSKTLLKRFAALNEYGNRVVLQRYQIIEPSQEIRHDRTSPRPIIIDGYETEDGLEALKVGEGLFEIAGLIGQFKVFHNK